MFQVTPTHWPRILILWLCGILAALQFAKIAVAFGELQANYATSTASMGWVLSTVGMVGLLLGVTMGLLAPLLGYRRLLLAGLSLGGVLALLQSLLLPMPWFWGTRVLEGASHLAVVVAAPTLMAANAAPQQRSIAMGLWSTFVGTAFALAGAVGGPFIQAYGLPAVFTAHGAGLLTAAVVVACLFPADPPRTSDRVPLRALLAQHVQIYTHGTTALPGLCFFCYTITAVALLTFLPRLAGADRAWLATVLPLLGVCGTFCAGWLAHAWLPPLRLARLAYALVMLCALGWGLSQWIGMGAAPMSMALMLVSGLAGGSSFALIPALNEEVAQQARANGAVAQMGNLGSTLGPPSFALALSQLGAPGLMLCVLLSAALGMALSVWGSQLQRRGVA